MNLSDYGILGAIVSVVFGGVWKLIALIVKPIKTSIDKHGNDIIAIDKQIAVLIQAEDKNADQLIMQHDRIGRIDDRVIKANDKSIENDKMIVALTMKQEQFSKEKALLFKKTDDLEDASNEIKVKIAEKLK